MEPPWTRQLERDGYAIVRDVADEATVRSLRSSFEAEGDDTIQRGGAVYARRMALELSAVREWALSTPALHLARSVLGADARPVRGVLFDKRAEANWPVPWHQDLTIAVQTRIDLDGYGPWSVKAGTPHVQPPASVLEQMVTLRLHLDECPASNGALRVISGSHHVGKLTPDAIREMAASHLVATCEAAVGDVVLMRPLLLHSSSPSEVPSHRRVVHVEYAASALPYAMEWAESRSASS
ncbi:MAG: phytanoyl-CoA dioxygenase family protein [Bacteroidota bacterium]